MLNSGQVSFVDKVPGPQEAFKSAQRSRSGQEKLPEFELICGFAKLFLANI